MATICCLCGKQQHGMLPSFPLSTEHREFDICAECHQLLTHLEEHAQQNPQEYQKERSLLYGYLNQGELLPTVKDVITAQLYHCDTIAAPYLAEQKKKNLREKSAARIGNIPADKTGIPTGLTSGRVKIISWVILGLSIFLAVLAGATITPMFFFGEAYFNIGALVAILVLGLVLFLGCRLFAAHLANQEQILFLLQSFMEEKDAEESQIN